jgi:DNA-binding transcriptional LysR family regulator
MELLGDLADLRAFLAVLNHGGLTSAARRLGETKGTVSRRMTRLEQQLGLKLLQRNSRAVAATEAGLAFQQRVVQALALLDEGATELQDAMLEPSGHLRLTMPTDLGLHLFAAIIADFAAQYPQIRIEVLLTESFLDLAAYQIDIAIRAASSLTDSQYILHRLADAPVQFFASPAYLAQQGTQQGTPNCLADLTHHKLLLHQLYAGSKPLEFSNGRTTQRLKLTAHLQANDFAWLKQMALTGAGIATIPKLLCDPDSRLVQVLPEWSLANQASLYLLHEGRRLLPAKVTCFREFVRQWFTN